MITAAEKRWLMKQVEAGKVSCVSGYGDEKGL